MGWLNWFVQFLPKVYAMPENIPTPEQQALISATTDLVVAFATLVEDNAKMQEADDAYDAILAARAQHLADFNSANAAFSANPTDAALLQNFLQAIQVLGADSQSQAVAKVAKDEADTTDGVAVNSYNAVMEDTKAKFEAFIAANSVG